MKKIIFCFSVIVLLSEACATKKVAYSPPVRQEARDTTRQDVEGIQSALVLHPVENTIDAGSRKLHFVYDYPNRYLGITDNDAEYSSILTFIPETITVKTVIEDGIKSVASQLSYINPMASLTDEVKTQVTQTQGIKFTNINQYQIGKLFNLRAYSLKQQTLSAKDANRNAMAMLLTMLKSPLKRQQYKSSFHRIAVDGEQGRLTFHPIKNSVKGVDGKDYDFFLDLDNHCIYITDKPDLYEKFSTTLPFEMTEENLVLIQGVSIDPFVFLEKNSLTQMTQELGFQLDGGNNSSNDINKFRVAKISNYAMVINYPAVADAISAKLGISQQPAITTYTAPPVNNPVKQQEVIKKKVVITTPTPTAPQTYNDGGYHPPSSPPPSGNRH